MKFWFKFRTLFRREKLDADMSEEMRAHLEMQTQANRAAGMSPDEARYAAQRQFGGVEQLKEQVRDRRGGIWLEQLYRDLRLAVRSLRRTPSFTITSVATLALGLALVASTFAVINAYLLRAMPFPAAQRLHHVIYAPV